jgi:hypothetical protein
MLPGLMLDSFVFGNSRFTNVVRSAPLTGCASSGKNVAHDRIQLIALPYH